MNSIKMSRQMFQDCFGSLSNRTVSINLMLFEVLGSTNTDIIELVCVGRVRTV